MFIKFFLSLFIIVQTFIAIDYVAPHKIKDFLKIKESSVTDITINRFGENVEVENKEEFINKVLNVYVMRRFQLSETKCTDGHYIKLETEKCNYEIGSRYIREIGEKNKVTKIYMFNTDAVELSNGCTAY